MSEIKEFKTESKRLLDLMINSIYTNKEIFLRELISNASDAIDKYHYMSLTNDKYEKRNDYKIKIAVDKENRMISIEDNGIGMTYDDLVQHLGTIANSGSLEFMKKLEESENKKEDIDIIGQFGVGFYSAFMVGKKVVVESRSPDASTGYRFTSTGEDTYEIEECERDKVGTLIKVYLRDDSEEASYSSFLEEWTIKSLVKKYSDYVRYPITMEVTKSKPKLDAEGKEIEGEREEYQEEETLNSMIPLWKKNKKDVTKEQLNEFYKNKFYDMQDPIVSTLVNVDGNISYQALLYIPHDAPYGLYTDKYEKGLQLYSKGVFIQDKCKELLPDYLKFVKGLVDSADLSLNISREILQQNKQLELIAKNVEKKILSELSSLMKDDFSKYVEFFNTYGTHLKYGIYADYGMKKDMIKDLLIYKTLNSDKEITLKQYKEEMKEGQKVIYYASGKTKEAVLAMPQMDIMKEKGYNVLVLTDDIDEFALMMMKDYDGVEFKSIASSDIDILSEEDKKKISDLKESKKSLFDKMKEILKDDVSEVRLSERLVSSPVCLVSGEGLTLEMERVLQENPENKDVKASRILEINPHHELFKAIEKVYEEDEESLSKYAHLLYNQALLIEGMPIKDPVAFSKDMCDLMIKAAK
ncbi:MAG: molecular chaperone HtpG [Bacilli bacterium]|nr:molecular chaperone HtpG [Bacillales bacterium]MDY2745965.1 molecular chaperone HtpG [Bacilli bacterium]